MRRGFNAAIFFMNAGRAGGGVLVERTDKDGTPKQHLVDVIDRLTDAIRRIRARVAGGAAGDVQNGARIHTRAGNDMPSAHDAGAVLYNGLRVVEDRGGTPGSLQKPALGSRSTGRQSPPPRRRGRPRKYRARLILPIRHRRLPIKAGPMLGAAPPSRPWSRSPCCGRSLRHEVGGSRTIPPHEKNRAYVNAASRAAADCRRSQSYQSPIPSPVRAES